jgi:hypothetical protein
MRAFKERTTSDLIEALTDAIEREQGNLTAEQWDRLEDLLWVDMEAVVETALEASGH